MICRFTRSSIALLAAYGLLLATFLGSVAAGQTAHLMLKLCSSSASFDVNHKKPTQQEKPNLACLTACTIAMVGFVPPACSVVAPCSSSLVSWRGQIIGLIQPYTLSGLSARGPPARV